MQFLCAPLLGRLSDRLGRRPVLLASLVGTSIGFAIMGVAPQLSGVLVWLFIARVIDGISGGIISTAQAYIADITSASERSMAMGLIGAAFGLGFILGPAIGGVMSHISISAPFYFAAFLAAINALAVYLRLPESLSAEQRSHPGQKAPIREVFKHGWHLPALMGSYFLGIVSFSIMTTNFALFTHKRFGYDEKHNGYIFAFIGLVGALVQGGFLRQMLKRMSEKSIAVCGIILLAIGLALLPNSQTLTYLLLTTCVIGIGNSFFTPTLNGLASRSAERNWQGRVMGLMQSAGSLGRFVGPLAAGRLLLMDASGSASHYGRTPFWAASLIMLLSLACALRLPAKPITAEE
jgi:MFS family permease